MPVPVRGVVALAAVAVLALAAVRGDSAGPPAYADRAAERGGDVILANGSSDASGDLEGEWIIVQVNNGTIVPGATATLAFTGGEVKGFAGCNYFWTRVMPTGDGMRFMPVSADPLVCSPALMEMETAILRAMGTVTGYRVGTDGALAFLSGDQTVLQVVRAP